MFVSQDRMREREKDYQQGGGAGDRQVKVKVKEKLNLCDTCTWDERQWFFAGDNLQGKTYTGQWIVHGKDCYSSGRVKC